MACAILRVQLTKGLDMELTVEKVNVDLEMGSVIITGYELSDIISEVGAIELLKEMDYSDVFDFVMQAEQDKKTEDEDYRSAVLGK